jgi:hypothetical protein
VELSKAQAIAGHEPPRTTKLYDYTARAEELTLDEIGRAGSSGRPEKEVIRAIRLAAAAHDLSRSCPPSVYRLALG